MRIAVYDEGDGVFAELVVAAAHRRGHLAKRVVDLDRIRDAFDTDPAAILVGLGRLDKKAFARIAKLRSVHEGALIYLAIEEGNARSTISALEQGATDILRKPLLPRELILRAELGTPTRGRDERVEPAIRVGDIEVDVERVRAIKANRELALTRMEFRLLYCLMQHVGRIAPKQRLLTFGWDSEEVAMSNLKTHISHLRRKLRAAGGQAVRIKSRHMLGYALEICDRA